MNLRRIKAVAAKERLQVFRDPSSILIAFILPILLIFLMGYAVNLDNKDIAVSIVSHENSSLSNELTSKFLQSPYFDIHFFKSENLAKQELEDGKSKAVLIIPQNFSKTKNVQLLLDASEPNTAKLIGNYVNLIVSNFMLENFRNLAKNPNFVEIFNITWFNKEISSRNVLIPGSIAIIMTLIGTLLTSLVMAREWEENTIELIFSTPISINELIIGKIIPYIFLSLMSMIICLIIAIFWYKIPFNGSFLILMLLSIIYLFPALSVGLLISAIAKNQFVASQAAIMLGYLPSFLLSGFVFEISNMPEILQILSVFLHTTYFVNCIKTIFLVGNVMYVMVINIVGMILTGLLYYYFVVKNTKRSLD